MLNENIRFTELENNKENGLILASYFKELDKSFIPHLSSYVSIDSYADKLAQYAFIELAKSEDNLAGLYAIYVNDIEAKIAFLSSIVVSEECKGKGLAQCLIQRAVDKAKEKGMLKIRLEVNITHPRALKFYEKFGFKKSEEQTNNSDTILMDMALNKKDVLISVCMITYMHENFITEAIEGVLSQKTNFIFEFIIAEDLGSDKTRDICIAYAEKYPNIIKLQLNEKNLGPQANIIAAINSAKGQYIALCEGDDYWINPDKLQTQIDFLESAPQYAMCAHNAKLTYDNINFSDIISQKTDFNITDILLTNWTIMTASIVFRKDSLDMPTWFKDVRNGDFALQLLLCLKGDIKILTQQMSIYRQHPAGISSTLKPLNQAAWLSYLLYEFDKHTNGKYAKLIRTRIENMYKTQIAFAKEYHLRKQRLVLSLFNLTRPLAPFAIKNLRK